MYDAVAPVFVKRLVVGDHVIGAPSSNFNDILGLKDAVAVVPPAAAVAITAID